MYNIRTLERVNTEILHHTFLEAFSDYSVKMDLPLAKFQYMLQRRGYFSEISVGGYIDEELVGFILNGFRQWNGKPTAYDTGTGVIAKYRKQGLTSNMFQYIRELLIKNNINQYLLEVIQSNTSAVQLYLKEGFSVTRAFHCFQLDRSKYISVIKHEVESVDGFNTNTWEQLIALWDFHPSWQNSIDSINSVYDSFSYSVVRIENKIVGYGIIEKNTGDIPQIAVHKSYRRQGIGRSILASLLNNTESQKISVINVETEPPALKNFLLAQGFNNFVDQYEMILKL